MDFLIRAYWYQAEPTKLHIKVTDAAGPDGLRGGQEAAVPDRWRRSAPSSARPGQTMQDILFRVRVNQIFKKLLAKHSAKVTPAAIPAYYDAHLTQFGTPETRDIRIVRTNSAAAANAAKAALGKGQSWNAVAKKYSVDTATKNNGGLLTGVTKGQEEQALDTAAFSAAGQQGRSARCTGSSATTCSR